MSPLTVDSLSEAQENMEVGHRVVGTVVVTYKKVVIVVVGKGHTNKKQWKECKFSTFKCDLKITNIMQNSYMYMHNSHTSYTVYYSYLVN